MNSSDMTNLLGMLDMGDITTAYILWVVLFSVIGIGYFFYGKKQNNSPLLIIGIVLMIYPMFITNTYIVVLVGLVLTITPYFL